MSKKDYNTIINVEHPICCGLDVHKKSITACLITTNVSGKVEMEIREFKSFTAELLKLKGWLQQEGCPIVAMESTGIYWRPVHNILEEKFKTILINPRHAKNLKGKKTDINDSKWIAELLRHGLLTASFIPSKEVRQWRNLTTFRTQLTNSRSDFKRRVQKLFETANIKLDSVLSDIFGRSGRNIMELLVSGKKVSKEDLKKCVKGRAREKIDDLLLSLRGFFEKHHRFMLEHLLQVIDGLEKQINEINEHIKKVMVRQKEVIKELDDIPGIAEKSAQSILGEIGTDLKSFPSDSHFTSWSGICPGNNQSAGKRYSGRSPVRKKPIKTLFIEAAWSAIKKKNSYYRTKYFKLKARRGAKKAIVAIAHRIAKAVFHIIKYGKSYNELGPDHLKQKHKNDKYKSLMKQANSIGYQLVPETLIQKMDLILNNTREKVTV